MADWKLLISNEAMFENENNNYFNETKDNIIKFDRKLFLLLKNIIFNYLFLFFSKF